MIKRNEFSFSDRLRRLYDAHYETVNFTEKRGWSQRVAKDLLAHDDIKKSGLLVEWSADTYGKKRHDQFSYISGTLKNHLEYESPAECIGRWLEIYRVFFGCSAAYLFGEISGFTAEETDIQKKTGLSPRAIRQLLQLKKNTARMPIAAEMLDTLSAILSRPDPMADFLQCVGNILGTCTYTASGGLVDDLPEIQTNDPAFIRVVQDRRLAMAIDNLKKTKK